MEDFIQQNDEKKLFTKNTPPTFPPLSRVPINKYNGDMIIETVYIYKICY